MPGPVGRRGRPRHPDVLTPAEWRVLEHLREGITNAEIAVRLGITPDGVKYHVSNMLAKLGLPDRTALAAWQPRAARLEIPGRGVLRALFTLKVASILGGSVLIVGAAAALALAALSLLPGESDDTSQAIATPTPGPPAVGTVLHPASFVFTQSFWSSGRLPGDNRIGETRSTGRVWYRSPGQWRAESTIEHPPNPSITSAEVISGGRIWQWTSDTQTVQENPGSIPEPGDAGGKIGELSRFGATDMDALQALWRICYSPVYAGEETVAGRATLVFDLGATRCPSASAPDLNGPTRLWVDRETLFTLKSVVLATDGSVAMRSEISAIRYDVDLPDDLFQPLVAGQTPTLHP
jgi:DNA-binding CsgD family transcriptional regulator